MIVRRLDKDVDLPAVLSWYEQRGYKLPERPGFPSTGFIVPDVAAGFLVKTDAGFAILEPFIANPNASYDKRDYATLLIMERLVKEAKKLGFNSVFGFSKHKRMVNRAISLGFKLIETDSSTVWKDLE